jgi:hypothetical protein
MKLRLHHLHDLQFLATPAVLFSACMLMAGCATPPPTQIVEVPVHTPCVKDVPARPAYEFDKLPLDAPAGKKVLALARDWLKGRKYEALMEATIVGCM